MVDRELAVRALSLIEAEGRRFLVANSSEGTRAFYALDGESPARKRRLAQSAQRTQTAGRKTARFGADRDLGISWQVSSRQRVR